MKAIEIRDIGQAIERAAVGRRDEDVVVSGVGERRAETAQHRLGDAIGRRAGLADAAGQAGLVDRVAGDVSDADQFYARGGGGEQRRCTEKQGGSQGPSYAACHSITAPLSELYGEELVLAVVGTVRLPGNNGVNLWRSPSRPQLPAFCHRSAFAGELTHL